MGAVMIGGVIARSIIVAIAAMLHGRHGVRRRIGYRGIRREASANKLNRREQGGDQGQFPAPEKGQLALQS